MALDRGTPTAAGGGLISGADYADAVNEEVAALWARAICRLINVGGTANAITAECSPELDAHQAGQSFWLTPTANNTGAVVIDLDGRGNLAIVDEDGDALVGNELVANRRHLLTSDGTQLRLMGLGGLFALGISISGVPNSNETIEGHVFTDKVVFPAGLSNSRAVARTEADASAVFTILKNGSSVGTITFDVSDTIGTFAAASDFTCSPGDTLDIQCPNPADATLSGIKMTLRGTR